VSEPDDPDPDDPVSEDPVPDDPVSEDPVPDDPVLDDPELDDPASDDPESPVDAVFVSNSGSAFSRQPAFRKTTSSNANHPSLVLPTCSILRPQCRFSDETQLLDQNQPTIAGNLRQIASLSD
jgi:hypothetical protein